MPRAVRLHEYGGPEVLKTEEVPQPVPAAGQVLVRVKAAGINPGEASIRKGVFKDTWPSSFPSGQGSDFAGVIEAVGEGVESTQPGAEVIGFTHERASQADFVVVPQEQVTPKPANVPWEVAGALFVAGTTAYAAVNAVDVKQGDIVAVSGASGGVGTIAVQLARLRGARVLGIASPERSEWLTAHGVEPVPYGDGLRERLQAAGPVDAFIDTYGQGYVQLAVELGVSPQRINTIIDFGAVKQYGVKSEGNAAADRADVLAELAALIADGQLEVPVARVYPLDQVQEAYRDLEDRHTLGKIVLVPGGA
ncbi:NADP-dependent oxidoreductase (plasmid) [Deinococcus sp. KNUC1210]|uniref:NADP-dependent oxidoreductase n=1 Tax=Deinococcus sp. KNUC1210 TaxID=2917691 RepID=UPI001EF11478|nr:NADP-dependent oxidoreductase [Deinococcus sp. KNUC1210]ULH14139.1 NADP-dependent oxidoreductase [Deinococcus sp. KNUC1210]